MISSLTDAFVYCPEKCKPAIQVGRPGEKGIIFWLKYNDEAINKCAGSLIKELGVEIGVNNVQSAKKILLDFSSYAFKHINADFFSLGITKNSVSEIFTEKHRGELCLMFMDYIHSKQKHYPFLYTIRFSNFKDVLKLNDNIYIYGSGEVDRLIYDIKNKTEIEIPRDFLNEEDIKHDPLVRYMHLIDASMLLVYACSKDEAIEFINRFFGALCLTINTPFKINQLIVDKRITSFDLKQYHVSEFRTNLPAVYEINIHPTVEYDLKKMFSSPSKRMNASLSFIAHGWTYDTRERFLNHFIALDALYGTVRSNREMIVGGVCRDASNIDEINSKIVMIYDLRCKFVHGEISIFSDHPKYLDFIDAHGVDPVLSLFEILKTCALNYHGLYPVVKDKYFKNLPIPIGVLSEVKDLIYRYNESTINNDVHE